MEESYYSKNREKILARHKEKNQKEKEFKYLKNTLIRYGLNKEWYDFYEKLAALDMLHKKNGLIDRQIEKYENKIADKKIVLNDVKKKVENMKVEHNIILDTN